MLVGTQKPLIEPTLYRCYLPIIYSIKGYLMFQNFFRRPVTDSMPPSANDLNKLSSDETISPTPTVKINFPSTIDTGLNQKADQLFASAVKNDGAPIPFELEIVSENQDARVVSGTLAVQIEPFHDKQTHDKAQSVNRECLQSIATFLRWSERFNRVDLAYEANADFKFNFLDDTTFIDFVTFSDSDGPAEHSKADLRFHPSRLLDTEFMEDIFKICKLATPRSFSLSHSESSSYVADLRYSTLKMLESLKAENNLTDLCIFNTEYTNPFASAPQTEQSFDVYLLDQADRLIQHASILSDEGLCIYRRYDADVIDAIKEQLIGVLKNLNEKGELNLFKILTSVREHGMNLDDDSVIAVFESAREVIGENFNSEIKNALDMLFQSSDCFVFRDGDEFRIESKGEWSHFLLPREE